MVDSGGANGAAANDFLSGAVSSQGGYLAGSMSGDLSTATQNSFAFPGASGLSENPEWVIHSLAAYGGAHAGAIVERVKFVSGERIESGTGDSRG